jgi:hypothetical protein
MALLSLEQAEMRSARADSEARQYLRDRFGLHPSERIEQDPYTGELIARIDLRWSVWTDSIDSFRDRAPYTLRLIRQGVIDGYLEEEGGALRVISTPHKESRAGEIMFMPAPEAIAPAVAVVVMSFWSGAVLPVYEDEIYPEPNWSLQRLMTAIDNAESRAIQEIEDQEAEEDAEIGTWFTDEEDEDWEYEDGVPDDE